MAKRGRSLRQKRGRFDDTETSFVKLKLDQQ